MSDGGMQRGWNTALSNTPLPGQNSSGGVLLSPNIWGGPTGYDQNVLAGIQSNTQLPGQGVDDPLIRMGVTQVQAPMLDGSIGTITIDPSILNWDFSQHNGIMNLSNGAPDNVSALPNGSAGNSESGLAKAFGIGGDMLDGEILGAGPVMKMLGAPDVRAALKGVSGITAPISNTLLGAGEAVQAAQNIQSGVTPIDAGVGALAHGGLVYGTGIAADAVAPWGAPFTGIVASQLADHTLPSSAKMGAAIDQFLTPLSEPGLEQYDGYQVRGL